MKRFYKDVTLEQAEGGMKLLLDGRPVKSPAKDVLVLPEGDFAKAVAQEWRAQGDEIFPAAMPLTRLSNSVIDGVAARRDEVIASIAAYGQTDLICYWAESPPDLVTLQAEHWQPVLNWAEEYLGHGFVTGRGVLSLTQGEAALAALADQIAQFEDFALAALYEMTSLTGSVLLALATVRGQFHPDAAWRAAHVDEAFQIKQWGEDDEAAARHAIRKAAFGDAVRAIQLLGVLS